MSDEEYRRLLEELVATRQHFDVKEESFRRQVATTEENLRRHFDIVAEGLQAKIQQVAEGVASLDDRLERFRGEVATEFSEVRAMIKFSYTELDRRVRVLEDSLHT